GLNRGRNLSHLESKGSLLKLFDQRRVFLNEADAAALGRAGRIERFVLGKLGKVGSTFKLSHDLLCLFLGIDEDVADKDFVGLGEEILVFLKEALNLGI